MLFIVDVDDTICHLVERWLNVYNKDHNDHLISSDILGWDIGNYTKIKDEFYNYIRKPRLNLYNNRMRFSENSLSVINKLKNVGHKFLFATANDYRNRKHEMLYREGYIQKDSEYAVIYDKKILCGDVIIDDKYDYVLNSSTRIKILFDQPWNQQYIFPDKYQPIQTQYRVKNWMEIGKLFGVEL